ncbi:hypothetical protein GPECTOR_7g1002 [Gonium pectorale]|uniref:Vps41 beta-propeller domain-containing protein n=1 Tax=Gonium pectorale TaxID=33097 RepID=A0A150GTQ8_GONPE|nr:hypothetical protein GPECTOR_7g1002 [Gonium pectorale]|eukprot:KXZ53112.1 hypothetical protein GPECTOR_7g1002 [Gonium pectorale]
MASPDEEPEPQLKYELLGGDVREILSKEQITCMTLSEKIVALGTEQGNVHVLDYSGNQVRLLKSHRSRVNDLSFDKEAELLASASNDCSVVVSNLYTEQVTRHEFKGPIKVGAAEGAEAVALDPRPPASSRRTWRDFATGSSFGEVTLHTQGWLARADTPLAGGSSRELAGGGVLALKWSGQLLAWATHSAVTVYDTAAQQILRTLRRYDPRAELPPSPPPGKPPQPASPSPSASPAAPARAGAATGASPSPAPPPRAGAGGGGGGAAAAASALAGLRRCSLVFAPDAHLYVAWSDSVLVARISSYENNVGWLAPQLELVARLRSGEAVLAVATARSRDPADRLAWLLARRRWEEALEAVETAPAGSLPPGAYDRVVDGYIEELMTRQLYDRAVELSGRLLKADAGRWERFVYLFAQVRQLPKLVARLPTDKPRLRPQVYDMALQSLLAAPADHPTLLSLATKWPPGTYSLAGLADAVAARIRRGAAAAGVAAAGHGHGHGGGAAAGGGGGGAEPLWQLLAWLYEQQGRPDLALSIHLRLRSPAVFDFITTHGLHSHLLGRAPDLYDVDERAAAALLTAHAEALPPGNVVPSLQAIDFVVGARDPELWLRLIDWALSSPATTGDLLDCIGGHVEPLTLVRRIPRGMRVERLRDRLRAIIADYRTQTSLREGCNAILRSDCRHLMAKLYDGTKRVLPYAYVNRPGVGGEPGQWFRCDVIHAGRMAPVSAAEVPWEAQEAYAADAAEPGHGGGGGLAAGRGGGRPGSGANLEAAASSSGLTRTNGSSAPALTEAAGQGIGGRRRTASAAAELELAEGLPWWAREDGGTAGSGGGYSAGGGTLWVGFNLAAGAARLGGEECIRAAPDPEAAELWQRRLYDYLSGLFAVDSSVGADYHDLQVSLTAAYQPSKLMDLLASSQYYSLESALSICESRGLVPEQVFVLGRMGATTRALRLIIDRLRDIPRGTTDRKGQD